MSIQLQSSTTNTPERTYIIQLHDLPSEYYDAQQNFNKHAGKDRATETERTVTIQSSNLNIT